jgi:hypothetical protein
MIAKKAKIKLIQSQTRHGSNRVIKSNQIISGEGEPDKSRQMA